MGRFVAGALVLMTMIKPVYAENIRAVQLLPGYVCMKLALKPEQNSSPRLGVPVRDVPSPSAPIASWAPSVVVVPAPQKARAGFLRIFLPDKHEGWIQAVALEPWSNPYAPSRRCFPAVMSDGGIGYDFR